MYVSETLEISRATNVNPTANHTEQNKRPISVVGDMSPYPMVRIVTMHTYRASMRLQPSVCMKNNAPRTHSTRTIRNMPTILSMFFFNPSVAFRFWRSANSSASVSA